MSKIQFILTDVQLAKFCELFNINPVVASALNDIACLDVNRIKQLLIRKDFEELSNGIAYPATIKKAYTFPELKHALAKMYRTTVNEVDSIVKDKKIYNKIYCKKCGIQITSPTAKRTGGLCSQCFVEQMGL